VKIAQKKKAGFWQPKSPANINVINDIFNCLLMQKNGKKEIALTTDLRKVVVLSLVRFKIQIFICRKNVVSAKILGKNGVSKPSKTLKYLQIL